MIRGGTGMTKSLVTWSGSWGVRRNYEFKITVIFSQKFKGGGGGLDPHIITFLFLLPWACHLEKLCKVMLLTQKTEKNYFYSYDVIMTS